METGSALISEDATKISELGRRSRSRSSVIGLDLGLGLEEKVSHRPLAPALFGLIYEVHPMFVFDFDLN